MVFFNYYFFTHSLRSLLPTPLLSETINSRLTKPEPKRAQKGGSTLRTCVRLKLCPEWPLMLSPDGSNLPWLPLSPFSGLGSCKKKKRKKKKEQKKDGDDALTSSFIIIIILILHLTPIYFILFYFSFPLSRERFLFWKLPTLISSFPLLLFIYYSYYSDYYYYSCFLNPILIFLSRIHCRCHS